MTLSLPEQHTRLDQLRRLAFGLRVFGRNVTPSNLRALGHHLRLKYVDGQEVPVAAVVGLTYRCQCECEHCSVSASPRRDTSGELTTPELCELLTTLRDMGVVKVTFFGGEPLVHPDVFALAEHGIGLGLRISIDTNGILLTDKTVKRLADLGVSNVNVSLDSPHPDEHNRLRRHPQAYQRALEGLRRLDAHGVPAMVSTYVTNRSLHNGDFARTVQIARDNGAKGVKVLLPMVAGRWQERPDMALSPDDERIFRDMLDPGYVYVEDALQNLRDGAHQCTAVNKSFIYISPTGDLQPCPAVPVRFGSVRKEALRTSLDRMWGHKAFEKDCGICAMNEPDFRRRVGLPEPGEGEGHRLVDAWTGETLDALPAK